jgi:hypothetical protein
MNLLHLICTLLVSTMLSVPARSADVTVESGSARTHLLELFTSEGCSSCPPAERWFSALRKNPRLWKDLVPIAFHVDYWDNLGWRDPLASKDATARQRDYAASWGTNGVYTPGFVLDGQEWRDRSVDNIPVSTVNIGKLAATLRANGDVQITFQSTTKPAGAWMAHAALLGFGLTSDVKAGENTGRKLVHDFAVLSLQNAAMTGQNPHTTLRLPADKMKPRQTAFAVWVTEAGSSAPVQAVGGEL